MEAESAQINIFMIDNSDGLGPIQFVFKIYPEEANQSRLRDWIELCGGVVLDPGEDDPYAITILDSHWLVEERRVKPGKKLPPDVFCPSFIYKSFFKKKVVDLNIYRISKSVYQDFNANLILTRKMAWNELERIPQGAKPRKQTGSQSFNNEKQKQVGQTPSHSQGQTNRLGPRNAHDDGESNARNQPSNQTSRGRRRSCEGITGVPSSSERTAEQDQYGGRFIANNGSAYQVVSGSRSEQCIQETAIKTTENSKVRRGVAYTLEEGQVILDFICQHQLHDEVKGNRIWTLMKENQVLLGRTALSMKGHFRKKIFPAVTSKKGSFPYACSADDKQCFQKARLTKNRGKNIVAGVPQRFNLTLSVMYKSPDGSESQNGVSG